MSTKNRSLEERQEILRLVLTAARIRNWVSARLGDVPPPSEPEGDILHELAADLSEEVFYPLDVPIDGLATWVLEHGRELSRASAVFGGEFMDAARTLLLDELLAVVKGTATSERTLRRAMLGLGATALLVGREAPSPKLRDHARRSVWLALAAFDPPGLLEGKPTKPHHPVYNVVLSGQDDIRMLLEDIYRGHYVDAAHDRELDRAMRELLRGASEEATEQVRVARQDEGWDRGRAFVGGLNLLTEHADPSVPPPTPLMAFAGGAFLQAFQGPSVEPFVRNTGPLSLVPPMKEKLGRGHEAYADAWRVTAEMCLNRACGEGPRPSDQIAAAYAGIALGYLGVRTNASGGGVLVQRLSALTGAGIVNDRMVHLAGRLIEAVHAAVKADEFRTVKEVLPEEEVLNALVENLDLGSAELRPADESGDEENQAARESPLRRLLDSLNLLPHFRRDIARPPPLALLAGRAILRSFLPEHGSRFLAAEERIPPSVSRAEPRNFAGAWSALGWICLQASHGHREAPSPQDPDGAAVAGTALLYLAGALNPEGIEHLLAPLEAASTSEGLSTEVRDAARRVAAALTEAEASRVEASRGNGEYRPVDQILPEFDLQSKLEDALGHVPRSDEERPAFLLDLAACGRRMTLDRKLLNHGGPTNPQYLGPRGREGMYLLRLARASGTTRNVIKCPVHKTTVPRLRTALRNASSGEVVIRKVEGGYGLNHTLRISERLRPFLPSQ